MTQDGVRAARFRLGLSVRQFAVALGMPANGERVVRRWEAGQLVCHGPAEVAIRYMVTHGLDDIARNAIYEKVS